MLRPAVALFVDVGQLQRQPLHQLGSAGLHVVRWAPGEIMYSEQTRLRSGHCSLQYCTNKRWFNTPWCKEHWKRFKAARVGGF